MAANYWASTQHIHWTFTRSELTRLRAALAPTPQPTPTSTRSSAPNVDPRHLFIFFQTSLVKLARRLNLRQQPLATALIYLKRFYLRHSPQKTNPYLLMCTAIYLACKMEEMPQHIRLMLGEAARQWPEWGVNETGKIGECEFLLISTLRSALICHHPYRALQEFSSTFSLGGEETSLASNILNDSFATDLPLLYPPHIIALTAIFLAIVMRPAGPPAGLQAHSSSAAAVAGPSSPALSANAAQNAALAGFAGLKQASQKLSKIVDWLADSQVDMEAVVDATQEMVSLYECWEQYSERTVKDVIARWMREGAVK